MLTPYSANTNVYEHGIAIEGDQHQPSMTLIATTKLPIYSGFSLSILDLECRSLNARTLGLADRRGPHYAEGYYEEEDLKYCGLAALYHLNQLIDLYVTLTQHFERRYPLGTAIRGNINDPRVFYEIDAFFGAARRVYESIKEVLWKHYRSTGATGKWNSVRKVFNSPHKIPPLFLTELDKSWRNVGEKLADYRNCVMHYDPLNDGSTTCWMNWYESKWGMTVKLPVNPNEKSRKSFNFDSGPEALSYCHSVACHLIDLCESLEAQSQVASYLANPRTH